MCNHQTKVADPPTGLTDEVIDSETCIFPMLSKWRMSKAEARRVTFRLFARRIEAITRKDEENNARRILWAYHGCIGLYGDDGEQQCNRCRIDFKRDPLPTIIKKLSAARKDERERSPEPCHDDGCTRSHLLCHVRGEEGDDAD